MNEKDEVHSGLYLHGKDMVRQVYSIPTFELFYPREDNPENAKEFEIGLCDIRAADSIRVSYDFNRDGWVIKQSDNLENPTWTEVAFLPAWARDKSVEEEQDDRRIPQ